MRYYVISVIVIFLLSLSFLNLEYFRCYAVYLSTDNQKYKPSKKRIAALQTLFNAPVVGHFFHQQMIAAYASKSQWEKVLEYSSISVESPRNRYDYLVWFYKGFAQCILNKTEQCKRSARITCSLQPNNLDQFYSKQLFDLTKLLQKSNVKLVTKKNLLDMQLEKKEKEILEKKEKKGTGQDKNEGTLNSNNNDYIKQLSNPGQKSMSELNEEEDNHEL